LSNDLEYGNSVSLNKQLEEVSRLLEGYMKGIEGRAEKDRRGGI
jgi:hypothetical protein